MWLFYLTWIVSIVACILIVCVPSMARTVPTNYVLLGIFTFCEAYGVSAFCGLSEPKLVFMAATFTAAMFFALTLYACTTKTDFTMMGGALFVLGMIMMIFGIFMIFSNNNTMHIIYSALGAFMFSLYIIYDT